MRYRSKNQHLNVEIDAVRWTGEALSEVVDWLPAPDGLLDVTRRDTMLAGDGKLAVSHAGGVMILPATWWILRTDAGLISFCNPTLFEQHYEPVPA